MQEMRETVYTCSDPVAPRCQIATSIGVFVVSYFELLKKYENVEIIQRGKRKRFDWGKGIVGEDDPDTIIKNKIQGVTLTELIYYLNGNVIEDG